MDYLLADNGGEFLNEEYKECAKSSISKKLKLLQKVRSQMVLVSPTILSSKNLLGKLWRRQIVNLKQLVWAISAKSSLSEHQGYSPNMLVFALNPNYPNVLTNELPALET